MCANVAPLSLGRGWWTQAILKQNACNPTINKGCVVLGVQAPLDLSTRKRLNRQAPWSSSSRPLHLSPALGALPPQRNGDSPHPQCLSVGCRGRPLYHTNRDTTALWN